MSVTDMGVVSYRFFYLVIITSARRTANQVAQESCKEKLRSHQHHCQGDVEERRIGYQSLWDMIG
jgi:hypothetical protein